MRVLMLSWEYPPHLVGGLGKHVTEIIPALQRLGVEITLLTPRWAGGAEREVVDGAEIHRLDPGDPESDFHSTTRKTNLVLEQYAESLWNETGGYDVIHAHDWLTAFAAAATKRKYRTPLVATIHATEKGRGRGYLHSDMQQAIHSTEWWLTYEAWRIIACSNFMAQEIVHYFAAPLDKVDVIPNSISMQALEQYENIDLSGFREMYARPDEHLVFNIGRVVAEKGVQVLVEAVPMVLAEFPQAKVVIAGRGAMVDELKQRTEELGVSEKVTFCGFVSDEDRNRLYRVADCAVFPSLYEPFGIVALEAMAAKCPVVVASVGGLQEVVHYPETGITVYPDNPDSLAWGILHTLLHPDWTQARVASAFDMVLQEYNWELIAESTIQTYERVIRERSQLDWK